MAKEEDELFSTKYLYAGYPIVYPVIPQRPLWDRLKFQSSQRKPHIQLLTFESLEEKIKAIKRPSIIRPKKTRVAIDVPELLQCRDGERDKVTTLEKLLQRNRRDAKVNQCV
ncbi:hypothetical protein YC2023_077795 [Brassica napus]